LLEVRRLRLLSELARRGTIAEVATIVGLHPLRGLAVADELEREVGGALLERDDDACG
jgi:hypothetical protein